MAKIDDVDDPINVGTAMELINRKEKDESPMATCPKDGEPLVSTFEFRGAEFYCVVCQSKFGFLAPTPKDPTPELHERHAELKAQYQRERKERQG